MLLFASSRELINLKKHLRSNHNKAIQSKRTQAKHTTMGLTASKDTFCTFFTYVFGMYGVGMVALPSKMVTDHFDAPATPMTDFWIRCFGVAMSGLCYCVKTGNSQDMFDVALLTTIGITVLGPYNAKFGYLGGKLPTKYPMHYMPEVLMPTLISIGLYAKFLA